ncbi:hypothetical protein LX36DRAFT_664914, partial [Colletotrichum falcatum]
MQPHSPQRSDPGTASRRRGPGDPGPPKGPPGKKKRCRERGPTKRPVPRMRDNAGGRWGIGTAGKKKRKRGRKMWEMSAPPPPSPSTRHQVSLSECHLVPMIGRKTRRGGRGGSGLVQKKSSLSLAPSLPRAVPAMFSLIRRTRLSLKLTDPTSAPSL